MTVYWLVSLLFSHLRNILWYSCQFNNKKSILMCYKRTSLSCFQKQVYSFTKKTRWSTKTWKIVNIKICKKTLTQKVGNNILGKPGQARASLPSRIAFLWNLNLWFVPRCDFYEFRAKNCQVFHEFVEDAIFVVARKVWTAFFPRFFSSNILCLKNMTWCVIQDGFVES